MRRHLSPVRLAATGFVLLVVVAAVLWLVPAQGYYLFLPDTAHPLAPLVRVAGVQAQPDRNGGGIYFVDVRVRTPRLVERLFPGLDSGADLYPISAVRAPGVTEQEQQREDLYDMALSQRIAAAVALKRLGYQVTLVPTGVRVTDLDPKAPAARVLRPGDEIVAVDGAATPTIPRLRSALARHRPGDAVHVRFRRGTRTRSVTVRTVPAPENRRRAIIGFSPEQDLLVRLPLKIRIETRGVGGPSAGLAFALQLMEELGRDVDHGYKVAATGALDPDGSVEPIGGVKQKTIGAREAGVDVFLVPAGDNARIARRYADGLRVIPVESFSQALHALATLPPRGAASD